MQNAPTDIITCKRTVRLHEVEKDRGPTQLFAIGYATIAQAAGVKLESVWKAVHRGTLSLFDLPSIARFIVRVDARRNRKRPVERTRAGTGPEIKARIARCQEGVTRE